MEERENRCKNEDVILRNASGVPEAMNLAEDMKLCSKAKRKNYFHSSKRLEREKGKSAEPIY